MLTPPLQAEGSVLGRKTNIPFLQNQRKIIIKIIGQSEADLIVGGMKTE